MDEESKKTLLRIEQNDDSFTTLWIGHAYSSIYNDDDDDSDNNNNKGRFMSSDGNDFLRLGTSIAKNAHITKIQVNIQSLPVNNIDMMGWSISNIGSDFYTRGFCDGLRQNTSINELILHSSGSFMEGLRHEILKVYQENNNLTYLSILSANLNNHIISTVGDQIITTTLDCCTNLRTVNLYACGISARMLLPMVEAMRGIHSLENLFLNVNGISSAGCEALATLLEDPNSNLEQLQLFHNNIGNEGAIAIANSLTNNTKLQSLDFVGNPIVIKSVEDIFCRGVLCITSSISSICSSNHTLATLHFTDSIQHTNLSRLLQVNKCTNKTHVVMKKILQYHPNIDMNPLFGWDMEGEWTLKGLPYIIDWFNRAAVAVNDRGTRRVARAKDKVNYNVDTKKLSAIYEFAKAMPSMFVPTPHTTVDDDGSKKKRKRG